jgi:L-iditol 2-dehydrogenase
MVIPSSAISQGNIAVLDDKMDFNVATLAEPLSCVYNAFEKYKPHIGDNVLIIGAGPIGLLHAKLCRLAGCAKIFMQDLSAERLNQCKSVDSEIITIEGESFETINKLTGGKGIDVCVVACPSPAAQSGALKYMAHGGRLCFFGGIPKEKQPVSIDTNIIHYKEIFVCGSTRSSVSQYRKVLSFIETGILKVDDLITHSYKIDDINLAFENLNNAKGIKHIINFD